MKIYIPLEGFKNYVTALTSLGAEVSFTSPENCDALLLPGGADVNPCLYGQENMGSLGIDDERDKLELAAFKFFLKSGRPILGICRGTQLINVALGGTLFQDIQNHRQIEGQDVYHNSTTADEFLMSVYGSSFTVNSSHHQAVDALGNGLKAVQWADDGTVEAIRHDSLPIFGVQWHPERLREPTDGWALIQAWLKRYR